MSEIIARFSQGSGSMAQNNIDFIQNDDGTITKHTYAMGGSDKVSVSCVPDKIDKYKRLGIIGDFKAL